MKSACLLLACIALVAAAGAQTLYKSIGPDGKAVYSDRPPLEGRVEKTLKVQDLPNTALPPATLREIERLKKEGKSAQLPNAGLVLFSATWCGYCRQAKAHLAQMGVPYRDYDIDTPEGRLAFVQAGAGKGVPLLIAGNGERIQGYGKASYDALLATRR